MKLDTFLPIDLPSKGTLYSEQVFAPETFERIKTIDFSLGNPSEDSRGKRNVYHLWCGKNLPKGTNDGHRAVLEELETINHFDVFADLATRSAAAAGMPLTELWNMDLDTARKRFFGVIASTNRDAPGLNFIPHKDNTPVMLVYVHPDFIEGNGTTFHDKDDLSITKTLPFKSNTGFFHLDTVYGTHSVVNISNTWRHVVIFHWMFNGHIRVK